MRSQLLFVAMAAALAFVACTISCGAKRELTPEMASSFLRAYTAAVERGDSTEVSLFWSKESRDKKGFWMMHTHIGGCLPFSEFSEMLHHFTFEITDMNSDEDYRIVELDWVLKEVPETGSPGARYPMRYYLITEDDELVLINPVDLLTRDWQVYEGEHLTFHYPLSIASRDHLFEIKKMEQEAKAIAELLGVELPEKVDFYRPESPVVCGELLLQWPSYGYAFPPGNLIVSLSFINPHELVHLLTMPDRQFISAAFSEGIAVALGGGTWFNVDFSLCQARNLLKHADYIPLRDVLLYNDTDFLDRSDFTYHEAGGFVKFLLDRYGLEKFFRLQDETNSDDELAQAVAAVYGQTIDELEEQWEEYLQNLDIPHVGYSIPPDAELVFSMIDPSGDDIGDGDYSYPADERFGEGMFDLRRFEVLEDDTNAYFRLQFQNLVEPVVNETTQETFTAGSVIAIRRGDDFGQDLQRRCHGVTFEGDEGYDIRLDVGRGIAITNNFGKACYSSSDILDSIADRESYTIEFSLPISFVGPPGVDWKYFVGVCLMNDYGLGFLHGGPEPIHLQPRQFGISGGRDRRFSPRFMDILLPEHVGQVEILSDYNSDVGKRAVVPMVGSDL